MCHRAENLFNLFHSTFSRSGILSWASFIVVSKLKANEEKPISLIKGIKLLVYRFTLKLWMVFWVAGVEPRELNSAERKNVKHQHKHATKWTQQKPSKKVSDVLSPLRLNYFLKKFITVATSTSFSSRLRRLVKSSFLGTRIELQEWNSCPQHRNQNAETTEFNLISLSPPPLANHSTVSHLNHEHSVFCLWSASTSSMATRESSFWQQRKMLNSILSIYCTSKREKWRKNRTQNDKYFRQKHQQRNWRKHKTFSSSYTQSTKSLVKNTAEQQFFMTSVEWSWNQLQCAGGEESESDDEWNVNNKSIYRWKLNHKY